MRTPNDNTPPTWMASFRTVMPRIRKALREHWVALTLFGILISSFLLFSFTYRSIDGLAVISPDENNALFFSSIVSDTGVFRWFSNLNEQYDTDVFRPRLVLDLGNNNYTALHSPGYLVTLAAFRNLGLLEWAIPLFGLVLVGATYGVLSEVYGKKTGLWGAALVGTFPTVVFYSNTFFDIIPAMALFAVGLYLFTRARRTGSYTSALGAGVFLAMSVFMRITMLLPVIAVAFTVLVLSKRFNNQTLALSFIGFGAGFVPLLFLNFLTYGQPIAYSYALASDQGLADFSLGGSIGIVPILETTVRYLILYPLVFVGLTVVGIAARHKKTGSDRELILILMLGVTAVASLAAYGWRSGTYAFDRITPISSMARYLLPVHLLIILIAIGSWMKMRTSFRRILVPVILVVTIFSVFTSFYPAVEGSLLHQVKVLDGYLSIRDELQSLLDEGDQIVVFTKSLDKFLFPHVDVALVFTLSDFAAAPEIIPFFPISDIQADIIPLITRLTDDGFRVFLTPEILNISTDLLTAGFQVVERSRNFSEVLPLAVVR